MYGILYHGMDEFADEIPEMILDKLNQTQYHGFPLFHYTGIKFFDMEDGDTLYLKSLPENPNHLTSIKITFDVKSNHYTLTAYKKNQRKTPHSKHLKVSFYQLADIIVKEMGYN